MDYTEERFKRLKIIVITGGVMSGIGKGIVSASIGMMLKSRGFSVRPIKVDPYLNVDPGTMNPLEHGEVFVTEKVWKFYDKNIAELDQDFGNYERFLDISGNSDTVCSVHPSQNITSGQIFYSVLTKERRGDFLGKTVQMIPTVTDEIKQRILAKENICDNFLLVELGGTVGDIEGDLFLEAFRQLSRELSEDQMVFIHVCWIPFNEPVEEFKSKPSQHSTAILFSKGIFPDFIVCRSDKQIDKKTIEKIARFGNVPIENVIDNPTLSNIYRVPLFFEKQHFCEKILSKFNITTIPQRSDSTRYEHFVQEVDSPSKGIITIGIAGKYIKNRDSYYSIIQALTHAGSAVGYGINIQWIDTEKIESLSQELKMVHGILVPGGFGIRGTEGKIELARMCIEKKVPYLGICFGMQLAIVSFARFFARIPKANSTELDPQTEFPVIFHLPGQSTVDKGGTMRLGAYDAILVDGTIVARAYNSLDISERHRHRLEVNPKFLPQLKEAGLIVSGTSPDGRLVEFIELREEVHPFFVGTQAHPEFKSRLMRPAPLYLAFVQACKKKRKDK